MSPWFSMPPHDTAAKRAAVAEIRAVLAGIRRAAELVARRTGSTADRALAWAITRFAVRGERAVGRLEPPASRKRD